MSSEIVYGINPAREMLLHAGGRVEMIAVVRGGVGPKLKEILRLARSEGIKVEQKSREELDSLAGGGRHQGVVVLAQKRKVVSLPELLAKVKDFEAPVLFVLDGITDPRNLGAIIRSAEVLGGNGVIIGKDRSAGLSPTAVKASSGATEIIPVAVVVNVARSLKLLEESGYWVVGTAPDAEKTCHQYDWEGPTAVVLGSEERGMRRLVRESCHEVVRIPVAGKISSLNAASAAAIIMYEIVRQREQKREKGEK